MSSTVSVRIPTVLRAATSGESLVSASGETVGAVLDTLVATYPGLAPNLLDDAGDLRKFVNVYVNDEDIRFIGKLQSPVVEGDEVAILPAVAGG